MKSTRWVQFVVTGSFTAILVAYFLVWLPQPAAGLTFIGLDLGEWVKFLPQVRAGEVVASRIFFYLPPISLSMMILAWTVTWSDGRWQSWVVRILAVAIAFLAFPSVEAIIDEPPSEWLLRLILVILVLIFASISPLLKRFSTNVLIRGSWLLILLLGLIGAILPTWAYFAVKGPASILLQTDIGLGPGVWLNAAGHLLLVGTAAYLFITEADSIP